MNPQESATSAEHSQSSNRKTWTTPVVAVLEMGETANNATAGNDGLGPTTGS